MASQTEHRLIRHWIKQARYKGLDTPEGQGMFEYANSRCREWGIPEIDLAAVLPLIDPAVSRQAKKAISKPDIRSDVWDKTGGRCWYCGKQTTPWRDFAVDHFIATTAGGADTLDNLVPCCRPCNNRKGNRPIEQLRRRLSETVVPAFTASQLEYLHQQGITVPEVPAPYVFYFERMEGQAGA